MKKILVILLTGIGSIRAQQTIKCVVIDSLSLQAVEFANVGILNKGLGTVSNEQGEFTLTVPDSLLKQTLRVSMIGYQAKIFKISEVLKLATIELKPLAVNLNEVSVSAKKTKFKILGNETRTDNVTAGFTTSYLGTELAVRLNIKHKNTQLRKFKANIVTGGASNPAFRLNVYKVDKNGAPGENILKENVIIHVEQIPCFIDLDLSPYGIYTDQDVYIAIEWVKAMNKNNKVMFSAKLIGAQTYFKDASQDEWHKLPSVGVGLHAEVAY